jgi:hypothetical protein
MHQDPTGPPGQLYRGQFVTQFEGYMKHGEGVLHYEVEGVGRLVYEGEFVQNKKHGHGVLKWGNGQKYRGQFHNDDFDGDGNMTWPNGNQYVGQYANGKKHGIGTCFFPDGSKYYGQFSEGKRHGDITRVKADGTTQLLHYAMDKLEKAERISSEGGETHRSLISDCTTEVTVRSSASKSTHASSASSIATANEAPKSKYPQTWRVVDHRGAVVRPTDSSWFKTVGTVKKGEELTVVEVKGKKMWIVSPLEGWVSSRTDKHDLIAVRIDKQTVEL